MSPSVLVRIDRAIADNLSDIERSFGSQAGIVQDFIFFISRKFKTDLFGYTRFTLKEFCNATGRRRQELSLICPEFAYGNKKPPEIRGYPYSTVMDYALYSMLEKNIVFSSRYEIKVNGEVVHMHNFPILKDLKLNFSRKINEEKVYDVRLSDQLLTGVLYRYYTVNAESYRLVGKGRGGDSRKKLLIYLSKLNHVLVSTNSSARTVIPLDRLCQFADIQDKKPSHKKQNLSRMLNSIKREGKFDFHFDYLATSGREGYFVNLAFPGSLTKPILQKEHVFYCRLLEGLKSVYDNKKGTIDLVIDKDPFQCWLSNALLDTSLKAQVLIYAYSTAFNRNISPAIAFDVILAGNFLSRLNDVQ